MRVQSDQLSDAERMKTLDALYTSVSTLEGREATKEFLKDLLTESERIMLGRRILIARALLSGSTYDEIVEEFKVGKDTILRIHRWLDDQLPGYENVISEVEKEYKRRSKKKEERKLYATNALYRLKKKYPMHFLLFPMPKTKK